MVELIKHIKIKGFKSIESLDLEMKPLNVLIGANGAGKTNFISTFILLRNLSAGKLSNYTLRSGGASRLLHFGGKTSPEVSIDIELGNNGYNVRLGESPLDDSFMILEEFCSYYNSHKKFMHNTDSLESLLPQQLKKQYDVPAYTREYFDEFRVYHFHDTGVTAGFKKSTPLIDNDYLYDDAKNLAAFLYRLKFEYSDEYHEIVNAVKAIAPFFHDFYLEPQGEDGEETILLKWVHQNYDEPFSAQQFSDGTARFICMATLFLQPQKLSPRTVILDEPELGLHPAAIQVLADIIKSVTRKGMQVICSTQSIELANCFSPESFIVVDYNDGKSKFHKPNSKALKVWLEDYGMGDIWAKNLIGGRP